MAELRARLRDQLTVEKLFQRRGLLPRAASPDEDVAALVRRARRPSSTSRSGSTRRQIVVRTREEAAEVRDEVRRKPARFADVAGRASIAPEGKRGGDLGWFGRGQGMPEVFDVCFRCRRGAISDVVPSPYGFHVFQVIEKKPPSRRTLDAGRGRPSPPGSSASRRARAQEEYVAALRAQAKIQIDPAAVASVKP